MFLIAFIADHGWIDLAIIAVLLAAIPIVAPIDMDPY